MRIRDLYDNPNPAISFEFFPPKNDAAIETLFTDTVPGLKARNPAFISVTYGAGGGTRDTTTRIVQRLRDKCSIESMPHLTCVGSTQAMLGNFLDEVLKLGFENVLALRGDPPKDQQDFHATAGGFANATELIHFIRGHSQIGIGAACYPEGTSRPASSIRTRISPRVRWRPAPSFSSHNSSTTGVIFSTWRIISATSTTSKCRSSPASCRS